MNCHAASLSQSAQQGIRRPPRRAVTARMHGGTIVAVHGRPISQPKDSNFSRKG